MQCPWLWSRCLAICLHLWPITKHPIVLWLPFSIFPTNFSRKSTRKLAGKVARESKRAAYLEGISTEHEGEIPPLKVKELPAKGRGTSWKGCRNGGQLPKIWALFLQHSKLVSLSHLQMWWNSKDPEDFSSIPEVLFHTSRGKEFLWSTAEIKFGILGSNLCFFSPLQRFPSMYRGKGKTCGSVWKWSLDPEEVFACVPFCTWRGAACPTLAGSWFAAPN